MVIRLLIAVSFIFAMFSGSLMADPPQPSKTSAVQSPPENAKSVPMPDLTQKIEALQAKFDNLMEKLDEKLQEAETAEDEAKIEVQITNLEAEFVKQQLALAKLHKTDPEAFTVLATVALSEDDASAEAFKLIETDHLQRHAIGLFCRLISATGHDSQPAEALIRKVMEQGKNDSVKGNATFGLASLLKARVANQADELDPAQQEKILDASEKLFETVVTTYPAAKGGIVLGVQMPGPADSAEKELYELRHLRIGKIAPNIRGKDSQGREFQLTDYRGQIVVIDFWAEWCGVCMQLVPHERGMVKRLEGKPFALLGINTDEDLATLQRVEKEHQINWRSWFDGSDGPIAARWNIQYFPAIYVLDHTGKIRYKDLREDALEKAVNKLIKELEASETTEPAPKNPASAKPVAPKAN